MPNAFGDRDGDGIPNVDDYALTGEPCEPATEYEARLIVNPDTFSSTTTQATFPVTVRVQYRNLNHVDGSTVRILAINNQLVQTDPRFAALSWSVGVGGGTATFDLQDLIDYFETNDLLDQRVNLTITGTGQSPSGSWTFTGVTSVVVTS
jgi:hypothetical protein